MNISISIEEINFEIHSKRLKEDSLINNFRLVIPKSLNTGEKLSFIRNNLSFMIKDFDITHANLYLKENEENTISIIKIEAIIEELLSSKGVDICK